MLATHRRAGGVEPYPLRWDVWALRATLPRCAGAWYIHIYIYIYMYLYIYIYIYIYPQMDFGDLRNPACDSSPGWWGGVLLFVWGRMGSLRHGFEVRGYIYIYIYIG